MNSLLSQLIAMQTPVGTPARVRKQRSRILKKVEAALQPTLFLAPELPKQTKPNESMDVAVFEEGWKMWAPQPNGYKPNKRKAKDRFVKYVKTSEYEVFLRAIRLYTMSAQVRRGYGQQMCNWLPDWKASLDIVNELPPAEAPEEEDGLVI